MSATQFLRKYFRPLRKTSFGVSVGSSSKKILFYFLKYWFCLNLPTLENFAGRPALDAVFDVKEFLVKVENVG